jgi:hypothetical protein
MSHFEQQMLYRRLPPCRWLLAAFWSLNVLYGISSCECLHAYSHPWQTLPPRNPLSSCNEFLNMAPAVQFTMYLPIRILPLKPTSQHKFSENMLSSVTGNRLIGPSVTEDHTGAFSCLNFLRTSLPLPLKDVVLQTRWRVVRNLLSVAEWQNTLTARFLDLSFWFHKAVPRGRKISHLFTIYYGWQKDYWFSVEIARQEKNSCSDSWCRLTAYKKIM